MEKQIGAYPRRGVLVNNKKEQITDIHNNGEPQTSCGVNKARHKRHHNMWYPSYETLAKKNQIYSDGKQIHSQG